MNNDNSNSRSENWIESRAVVKNKPSHTIKFAPGMTQNIEIEVLNDTYWPWKKGCTLTLADHQPCGEAVPVEAFTVTIAERVKGKASTTVTVPLTMKQTTPVCNGKQDEIMLTFRNKKGMHFGAPIPISVECTSQVSDPATNIPTEQARISNSIQVARAGQIWMP